MSWMTWRAMCLADVARHVTGCLVTQATWVIKRVRRCGKQGFLGFLGLGVRVKAICGRPSAKAPPAQPKPVRTPVGMPVGATAAADAVGLHGCSLRSHHLPHRAPSLSKFNASQLCLMN